MNCTACNPTDTDMVELGDLQLYHQPVSVSVYDVRSEHVVCAPVAGLHLLHPAAGQLSILPPHTYAAMSPVLLLAPAVR